MDSALLKGRSSSAAIVNSTHDTVSLINMKNLCTVYRKWSLLSLGTDLQSAAIINCTHDTVSLINIKICVQYIEK